MAPQGFHVGARAFCRSSSAGTSCVSLIASLSNDAMRRVSRGPRRAAAARRASARTARAWLSVWLQAESERGTRSGRESWLTCYTVDDECQRRSGSSPPCSARTSCCRSVLLLLSAPPAAQLAAINGSSREERLRAQFGAALE